MLKRAFDDIKLFNSAESIVFYSRDYNFNRRQETASHCQRVHGHWNENISPLSPFSCRHCICDRHWNDFIATPSRCLHLSTIRSEWRRDLQRMDFIEMFAQRRWVVKSFYFSRPAICFWWDSLLNQRGENKTYVDEDSCPHDPLKRWKKSFGSRLLVNQPWIRRPFRNACIEYSTASGRDSVSLFDCEVVGR